MYLRIEQGSKEDHLRKINQLILKIFEYAAQTATFSSKEFEQFVKGDEVWTAKSYTPGSPFYSKIENLFTFSQGDRERIYRVIEHDMEFDRHIEEPNFAFEERDLPDRQIAIAKELILYLYDNLFRDGRFKFRNQTTGYREFKDSLFERNSISICPACLTAQTNLAKYGEVDHYFPKKSYPALIFHPINLAVICGECNDFRVKGEKNPLETGNLVELYIPYLRDAEQETELGVRCIEEDGRDGKREKVKKMVMVPRVPDDDGLISRRIRNLDNLFDLSSRWTDRMNNIIEYELEDLADEKLESEVQELLHNRTRDYIRRAAKNRTRLLNATTFKYIENEGREGFLAEWRTRRKNSDTMKAFWESWKS